MPTHEKKFGQAGPVLNMLLNIGTVFLLLATVIMILEGLSRYVLNVSYFWAEESVRFLMNWAFSLTIGIAGFRKMHIRTELLVQRFPIKIQRLCWLLSCVTGIVFALVLIYSSFPQAVRYYKMGIVSESNLELPMWLLYLAMPIAGFGLFWYYIKAAIFAWKVGDPFATNEGPSDEQGTDTSKTQTSNPLL